MAMCVNSKINQLVLLLVLFTFQFQSYLSWNMNGRKVLSLPTNLLQQHNDYISHVDNEICHFNSFGGSVWDCKLENYGCKVLGPLAYMDDSMCPVIDDYGQKKERKPHFNLNVGRALEGLRRELPIIFIAHEKDFSIFANQITVIDEGQRKIEVSKYIYQTVIKSIRMASAFSSIYPSMNVRKIEYIEDCQSIQCLVEVILPDAIRIDGQSVWQGMFYFGLNDDGLISSHVFDRKISKKTPLGVEAKHYPWIAAANTARWDAELISAALV